MNLEYYRNGKVNNASCVVDSDENKWGTYCFKSGREK